MLLDGYSQRRIASTLCVSRNTVAKVAKAASDHQLSKDALKSMEEMEIHNTLFPEEALLPTLVTPDFPYIHKDWHGCLIGSLYDLYLLKTVR